MPWTSPRAYPVLPSPPHPRSVDAKGRPEVDDRELLGFDRESDRLRRNLEPGGALTERDPILGQQP